MTLTAADQRRVLLAGLGIDFFQAVGGGGHEAEPDELAGVLEFAQASSLAFFVAAERDGHVNEVQARLAEQADRQAADDAFVVRVRGEEQGLGGVRSQFWAVAPAGTCRGDKTGLLSEGGHSQKQVCDMES